MHFGLRRLVVHPYPRRTLARTEECSYLECLYVEILSDCRRACPRPEFINTMEH
jgi:hypothetical protein